MGSKSKTTQTQTNPYAIQQFNSASAALGNKSYTPVTGADIEGFQNPYRSSVIDATLARSNQNRDMALNSNTDRAIGSGAFGGTGLNVENALTRGQYDLNDQQTISGLNAQSYSQALEAAMSQNDAKNKYPLALQGLLGQLAGQTQTDTSGTQKTGGLGPAINTWANWINANKTS